MNKQILDQLTFGFEIEGLFKQGLNEKLEHKGQFVRDGSVQHLLSPWADDGTSESMMMIPASRPGECRDCIWEGDHLARYCPVHHARYHSEGSTAQEYSSNIFKTFDSCLKALELFKTDETYVYNETCGLHFHIGMKTKSKFTQLYSAATDFDFMRQLYKSASKWCPHQAARLNRDGHFYAFWGDRFGLISDMKRGEKYRFVRFHPEYQTLEFRFLCPCEDKIANVKSLLEEVTMYLGKDDHFRQYAMAEVDAIKRADIKISKNIPKRAKETFDRTKKLFVPDDYHGPDRSIPKPSTINNEEERREYQARYDNMMERVFDNLGAMGIDREILDPLLQSSDWYGISHSIIFQFMLDAIQRVTSLGISRMLVESLAYQVFDAQQIRRRLYEYQRMSQNTRLINPTRGFTANYNPTINNSGRFY